MSAAVLATRGDITSACVDVIVNAANSGLLGGGGVDGAIHRVGGPSIVEECREIVVRQGMCRPGHAVITGAGNLPAKFIIHTVGPVWTGEDPAGLDDILGSCYRESLALATVHDARTIAFPNISTGVYGYPKARAASVSVHATLRWLEQSPHQIERVVFVCFEDENYLHYERLLSDRRD